MPNPIFRRENRIGADILEYHLLGGMTLSRNYTGAVFLGNLVSCNSDGPARRHDERHIVRPKIPIMNYLVLGG